VTSHKHFNTQELTSKPLPVGVPTAVTDLPYGKCKIKFDVFVSGWNIEENNQPTVSKIYADSTWT